MDQEFNQTVISSICQITTLFVKQGVEKSKQGDCFIGLS